MTRREKFVLAFNIINPVLSLIVIVMLYMFMQTRPMLNSRTVVQANTSRALDRLNAFLPEERCEMQTAWKNAQYYGEENVFANAVCESK